jgi:hypothetical protein
VKSTLAYFGPELIPSVEKFYSTDPSTVILLSSIKKKAEVDQIFRLRHFESSPSFLSSILKNEEPQPRRLGLLGYLLPKVQLTVSG